jgi:hypothetical protein
VIARFNPLKKLVPVSDGYKMKADLLPMRLYSKKIKSGGGF